MALTRIGTVSYLNTKPLVYGLQQQAYDCVVTFDLPSRLADQLASGLLDVALIPSIEAVMTPSYTIVSDACISSRGPVWSVKLLSRVAMPEIRSLALDEGSRTSAALARIILGQQFGCFPVCSSLGINHDWLAVATDAVLIIGDRAMKPLVTNLAEGDSNPFVYEWDLGKVWNDWTGYPFVFAVWAARDGVDFDRLDSILSACRNNGVAELASICQEQASQYDLTYQACHRYLSENLHFVLGTEEKFGLDLFFRYASQQSIIDHDLKLIFHDCPTAG